MSAPLPLMPFSIPIEPVLGSYSMNIPPEFRTSEHPQRIDLPTGVCLVRFTWDGKEGIRYRVDRAGHTGAWVVAIEESSVPVSRSSKIFEIAMTAPGILALQTTSMTSQETVSAQCRAGVTVIPTAGPVR